MSKYLLARHWHYFVGGFVLPFVILFVGFNVPFYVFNGAMVFISGALAVVISELVIYLWLWKGGQFLSERIESHSAKRFRLFKWLVILPMILILLVFIAWLIASLVMGMGKISMANWLMASLNVIIPMQIIFVLSRIYCFFYVAKWLKSVELKRNAKFSDFYMDFLWLLIFPIGIWLIQPRVNKVFG
ncbi:hypothetical protein ACT3CD_12425 [Geofilum sp. OHC36d9]|uniref:hypothetical protein n=1 Tax=Geofilum sp. OHC36d9 TaxID=3458413 RepID=UPI0040348A9D